MIATKDFRVIPMPTKKRVFGTHVSRCDFQTFFMHVCITVKFRKIIFYCFIANLRAGAFPCRSSIKGTKKHLAPNWGFDCAKSLEGHPVVVRFRQGSVVLLNRPPPMPSPVTPCSQPLATATTTLRKDTPVLSPQIKISESDDTFKSAIKF